MRYKKDEGWKVKSERPEEYLGNPKIYYTDEEIEKYSHSGGMRRAQEKIAYRVLEFLKGKNLKILDMGSGPGFTAEIYRSEGHNVTCLDLMEGMIEKAKEKDLPSVVGDMRDVGEIFKGKKFDAVVSVSALQWIKKKEEIARIAKGVFSLLEKGSPFVVQFYPQTEKEMKEVSKVFVENGFSGEIVIDWPEIPKNRLIFLVMKRN